MANHADQNNAAPPASKTLPMPVPGPRSGLRKIPETRPPPSPASRRTRSLGTSASRVHASASTSIESENARLPETASRPPELLLQPPSRCRVSDRYNRYRRLRTTSQSAPSAAASWRLRTATARRSKDAQGHALSQLDNVLAKHSRSAARSVRLNQTRSAAAPDPSTSPASHRADAPVAQPPLAPQSLRRG